MDQFPGNSNTDREREPKPDQMRNKVDKIVEGEVLRKKPSLGKRFVGMFFNGSARDARGYITEDVIIPAIRDTIVDVFQQGVERIIYGDVRSSGRRGIRSGSNGIVNYSGISRSTTIRRDPRDEPAGFSRRARANHSFDEIIIPTRAEAEDVIDAMFELISKFEVVTVADLYDLTGITGEYTDNKWGWNDIRGAGAVKVRNGYLLDLPRPEPLSG